MPSEVTIVIYDGYGRDAQFWQDRLERTIEDNQGEVIAAEEESA